MSFGMNSWQHHRSADKSRPFQDLQPHLHGPVQGLSELAVCIFLRATRAVLLNRPSQAIARKGTGRGDLLLVIRVCQARLFENPADDIGNAACSCTGKSHEPKSICKREGGRERERERERALAHHQRAARVDGLARAPLVRSQFTRSGLRLRTPARGRSGRSCHHSPISSPRRAVNLVLRVRRIRKISGVG